MDDRHRIGIAQTRLNLVPQVMERVLGFGEDNQFAAVAVGIHHQRVVEYPVELRPLGVAARTQHAERLRFQGLERIDLQAKLFDGLRRCRAGHHQVFEIVDLVLSVLIQILQHVVVQRHDAETRRPAPCCEPGLGKLALQPFTPPLEGAVDRGRRGRQPALQYLQGEANVVPFPAVGLREPRNAVHLRPHIVGDGGVERGFLRRQLVLGGIGAAFGKQGPRIEAKQFFLRQPPHHVGGVGVVDAVAEPALEAVAVEQRHE